ncbi:hypothetical protein BD779DRAFT_1678326 [Infundibulicybe gibba]|nr:hypothetical protein BD779DRAFT_1678326 [Infundibulicybe gibba]
MLVPSSFTTSVLPVQENVVKNIIFRVSALCLQLAVYNLCSYFAFKSKAYTSFLMFAEDHIQRFFFVSSRGWSRSAIIVLGFAILSPLAGLYDTLLWSLDSPGYVIKSSRDNAGSVSSIDAEAAITGNLFKSGFNFTLPPMNDLSRGDIVPARQSLADAGGPLIWLDDEGFSVGIDSLSRNPRCIPETTDDRNQVWGCQFPNNDSSVIFPLPLGQPFIWWDGNQSEPMRSFRTDNLWNSLGTGGDTAAMKQVFTVTKGRRRHTFFETVLKVSMVSRFPASIDDAEILEMVRRTFSNDAADNIQPATQTLADVIITTQANHLSFSGGTFFRQDFSVSATSIELLNVTNQDDRISPEYVVLRYTSTNITLIRSETLPNPVTPLSPCPLYFSNLATGGRLRSTTCYLSTATQDPGSGFHGQLDASAVLILSDVFGDGSTARAATALNETGLLWYQNHTEHIDQVLASRAFILGGDRGSVLVDVQHTAPALSYLQLLLSLIPTLIALVSILLIKKDKRGYFQSSFFAAVHATTHLDESQCDKVGYSHVPPEIRLDVVDGHVLLGTPHGGTLGIVTLGGMDLPTPTEKNAAFVNQDSYHTVPTMEDP